MWLGSVIAVAVASGVGSCSSIQSLAWELPYAEGATKKKKKIELGLSVGTKKPLPPHPIKSSRKRYESSSSEVYICSSFP